MRQYVRSLGKKLPPVPQLPLGFTVIRLAEAEIDDILTFLHTVDSHHLPTTMNAEDLRQFLAHSTLPHASFVAYAEGKLAAISCIDGARVDSPVCPAGTAISGPFSASERVPPAVLRHLIAKACPILRAEGYHTLLRNSEPGDAIADVLAPLGFVHTRTLQRMRLDLPMANEPTALSSCAHTYDNMRPLHFTVEPAQAACPDVELHITQLLGTSPDVKPGAAYMLTGTYTLRGTQTRLLTLAAHEHQHVFTASLNPNENRLVLSATIPEDRVAHPDRLYINRIDDDGAHPCLAIRLRDLK